MDGFGATQHELNPRWCLAYDTIDRHDIDRLIDWLRTYPRLTKGGVTREFESRWSSWLSRSYSVFCNSGSSANLLVVAALTSPRLGKRRLRPGDEIITVAAGFPTTVAPILQNGFVPVFIDNDPVTLNARTDQLEAAFVDGKTRAVLMAHTLGNPFDLGSVTDFSRRHDLWLIEDNCDALGCKYDAKYTGTFGDLSTQSFYPPQAVNLLSRLGGFLNLSGLEPDKLSGANSAFARVMVYRQIATPGALSFTYPVYAGVSFETGNVWQDHVDYLDDMILAGSVFLGMETPLGPLYFGYGYAEDGRDSLYMYLGRTF